MDLYLFKNFWFLYTLTWLILFLDLKCIRLKSTCWRELTIIKLIVLFSGLKFSQRSQLYRQHTTILNYSRCAFNLLHTRMFNIKTYIKIYLFRNQFPYAMSGDAFQRGFFSSMMSIDKAFPPLIEKGMTTRSDGIAS